MSNTHDEDAWHLGDAVLHSRLLIGSALYPSPAIMEAAIRASGAQVVTVSLRRQGAVEGAGKAFWEMIRSLGIHILPNTAGCHTAQEAITLAQMAREMFGTHWIKLEVIGDQYNLQPDPFATVEAARVLIDEGFEVFPYTTDDLVVAHRLVDAGCRILMPWGAPIGSGRGLSDPARLRALREAFPDIPLIVDAGIGRPSDAVEAMELGIDGILLNTAVAQAHDPVQMGEAFAHALIAGRMGYRAGIIPARDLAAPSTPTVGMPFWDPAPAKDVTGKEVSNGLS